MVSQFYERKRRLAYIFAGLSLALLIGEYYLGYLLEIYSEPRIVATAEGVTVLHRSVRPGEKAGSRVILLDDALSPRRAPYRLTTSHARAMVPDKEGLTTFFANRYSLLRGGETIRSTDLDQKWEIRDAVRGRDHVWIFGWSDGKHLEPELEDTWIVARRRVLGTFSTPIPVAKAPYVNRLTASRDGDRGPLVAWREEGSGRIRTALYNGTVFEEGETFEIGEIQHWDAVLYDGRTVVLYYHRDDRTFKTIGLRLLCCESCGKEPLPKKLVFEDPVLLLGKVVTGVAADVRGDRVFAAVTRYTTIQGGVAPLDGDSKTPALLLPLGAEPLWRHIAAAFTPIMMLFFSFSLVFLGFTLLREKGFFVLELINKPAEKGPRPAEILQRVMAYILDLIVIFPVFFVAVEVLNVSPESSRLDLADPKFRSMIGVWFALRFLYYFVSELAFGRSVGKKIIGIRVVELDGGRLTFRGALVRNLLRPIDAELLMTFFGASVMITSKLRQRLGDRLARTFVVQDERGPEAAEPRD